jgi:hypothetical protein
MCVSFSAAAMVARAADGLVPRKASLPFVLLTYE